MSRARVVAVPLVVAAVVLLAAACGGGGAGGAGPVGPCLHEYRSAVLEIVAAHVTGSETPVTRLVLRDVERNGAALPVHGLVLGPAHGLAVAGDALTCDVPCGFGTDDGTWTFTAEGAGLPARSMEVHARYAEHGGGCPSYDDGGTHVTIVLGP